MMTIRNPWTTMVGPIAGNPITLSGIVADPVPTTVMLKDGSSYQIPGGNVGSAAWARQASLIATAYRQMGDWMNAYRWEQQYGLRMAAYTRIEQGADMADVVASGSWLSAPERIVQGAASALNKTLLVAALGLVVVGIGFGKRSLRVRV